MIKTFSDKVAAAIFDGFFVHSLPRHIQTSAHRKLLMIDAAESIADLHVPPGNRLEALQGGRSGQWSLRVNAQWRICFHFVDGMALNVEITDYHR
jgi:toxin HigB-1